MNFSIHSKWVNIVLGALVLCLLAALGLLWQENKTLAENMADSKKQMEQRLSQVKALNVEKVIAAVQVKDSEHNAFKKWKQAKKTADYFYQKSGERFKKDWGQFLVLQANLHDIDPAIVYQLLKVETGGKFDPQEVGPPTKYGRAYGLAQFMENTAPTIAKMAGLKYAKQKLLNPYYSILLSITYLDYLHGKYHNWNKTLTAYNRGMTGLKNYIAAQGNAKSSYALKIQNMAFQMDESNGVH